MEFKKGIHYSTELERAVMGLCVLHSNGFGRIYGILEKQAFYHSGHQIVFEALEFMYKNGMPIDIFTVSDYIKRVKQVESIEGHNVEFFVCRLTNDVVNDNHLEYHCYIIKIYILSTKLS
jgi:replicative DNA helicase